MARFKIIMCALTVGLACSSLLQGQSTSETSTDTFRKHFTIGFRVRDFPVSSMSGMGDQTIMQTTTTPVPARDWNFTTTNHSPWWGAGISMEYVFNNHWSATADLMMNRLRYTKVTTATWGTDDPTTTADERSHMYINEDTSATMFELPLLVHYRGLFTSGALSNLFLTAGASVRETTKIKSSTLITYPDATTSILSDAVLPRKRNTIGAVGGVGFRVVDDFHIVWTPEVRYTRWQSSTFASQSTITPRNQLEVGLGFTF